MDAGSFITFVVITGSFFLHKAASILTLSLFNMTNNIKDQKAKSKLLVSSGLTCILILIVAVLVTKSPQRTIQTSLSSYV